MENLLLWLYPKVARTMFLQILWWSFIPPKVSVSTYIGNSKRENGCQNISKDPLI
jgi:hypothetical protein